MTNNQMKRTKLFFELIEYVNSLKENSDEIKSFSNEMFEKANDKFESQNNKVFDINLYILIRLYKDEYIKVRNKYIEKLRENYYYSLEEYYDFVENIEINDLMRELYIRMPKIVGENKILSYVTDMPSFMSMIR